MKYVFIILLIGFCQNLSALSNKDVALYKSIFKDYRDGNFKQADKNIEKFSEITKFILTSKKPLLL